MVYISIEEFSAAVPRSQDHILSSSRLLVLWTACVPDTSRLSVRRICFNRHAVPSERFAAANRWWRIDFCPARGEQTPGTARCPLGHAGYESITPVRLDCFNRYPVLLPTPLLGRGIS